MRLALTELRPGTTEEYPLQDDVVLRVDVHEDPGGKRLVEAALCNDRETPRLIPVNAWLYQTALSVEAGGTEAFLPVCDDLLEPYDEIDDELRRLRLQYRDRLEFAVGRTCSVDWDVAPGARRATRVFTTWLPTVETPLTEAVGIPDALLDMRALAKADAATVTAGLSPIVERYAEWLATQHDLAMRLPEHLQPEALDAVAEATTVSKQLAQGLAFLGSDAEALRCFRFMNEVMAEQRIATQVAALRAQQPSLGLEAAREQVLARGPNAHSWFT